VAANSFLDRLFRARGKRAQETEWLALFAQQWYRRKGVNLIISSGDVWNYRICIVTHFLSTSESVVSGKSLTEVLSLSTCYFAADLNVLGDRYYGVMLFVADFQYATYSVSKDRDVDTRSSATVSQ